MKGYYLIWEDSGEIFVGKRLRNRKARERTAATSLWRPLAWLDIDDAGKPTVGEWVDDA